MKTYSETQFKDPFDWNEFLNRKNITQTDWRRAYRLADNWVTCACGNQCDIIPKRYDGAPVDRLLRFYGVEFFIYIRGEDKNSAIEVLKKIEERSAILIKEIKSKDEQKSNS